MISENIIISLINSTNELVKSTNALAEKIDKSNKRYYMITITTIIASLITLCVFWACYFFSDYTPRHFTQETTQGNQIIKQEIK